MSYLRWTTEQERILEANANQGAAKAAEAIYKATGHKRSTEATRRHAYRVGLSLALSETCPSCGRTVSHLSYTTGQCKACTTRLAAERNRIRQAKAKQQADEYRLECAAAQREYMAGYMQIRREKENVTKQCH